MRRTRVIAGAALAVAALLASSLAAGAQPNRTNGAERAARSAQPNGGGGEFVVGYEGTATDAAAAIRDAGGTVIEVNESARLALASAPSASFLEEVKSEAGVTGAARNHSGLTFGWLPKTGSSRSGHPEPTEPPSPPRAGRARGRRAAGAAHAPSRSPASSGT